MSTLNKEDVKRIIIICVLSVIYVLAGIDASALTVDQSRLQSVAGEGDKNCTVAVRWNAMAPDSGIDNVAWRLNFDEEMTPEAAVRRIMASDLRLFGISSGGRLEAIGFLVYTKKTPSVSLKINGATKNTAMYSRGKPAYEGNVLEIEEPLRSVTTTTKGVYLQSSAGEGEWRYYVSADGGRSFAEVATDGSMPDGGILLVEYQMKGSQHSASAGEDLFYLPPLDRIGFRMPDNATLPVSVSTRIPFYLNVYENPYNISFGGMSASFDILGPQTSDYSVEGWSNTELNNRIMTGNLYIDFTPKTNRDFAPVFRFRYKVDNLVRTISESKVSVKVISEDCALSGLTFSPSVINVLPEGMAELRLVKSPGTPEAEAEDIDWSITNEKLGSFDFSTGVFKAGYAIGTMTVTASCHKNPSIKGVAKINVVRPEHELRTFSYSEREITVVNGESVTPAMIFDPEECEYKGMRFSSEAGGIASVDENGKITGRGIGETDIRASYRLGGLPDAVVRVKVVPAVPVERIVFEEYEPSGIISLEKMDILALKPMVYPDNADMKSFKVEIEDTSIATAYQVADFTGYFNRNYSELVTHSAGTTRIRFVSTDGSGIGSRWYTLKVRDYNRNNLSAEDYTNGIFWLNEEWYTHTNGSLNFIDADFGVHYRAYASANMYPYECFGATSQYGMVYAGRLFIMSKQNSDTGDTRNGGGMLVVADASTLRHIKDLHYLGGGDGRACVGATPSKIYIGTSSSIVPLDIDSYALGEAVTLDVSSENADNGTNGEARYSGQIGDMVVSGGYLFALRQDCGVHIIDIKTDRLVKTIGGISPQGIASTADGNVWIAANGYDLLCVDPVSLEITRQLKSASQISCPWSTWRSTNFLASEKSNTLWYGSGQIWRHDVDGNNDRAVIAVDFGTPTAEIGSYKGIRRPYGTIGYDEERNLLMVASNPGSGSLARYTWLDFFDADSGIRMNSSRLKDYYWFPSMPIVPDRYPCEISIDEIRLTSEEGGMDYDLREYVSDPDGRDSNIVVSLMREPDNSVAEAAIKGNTLHVKPAGKGETELELRAESEGRVTEKRIPVFVDILSGVDESLSVSQCEITEILDLNGVKLRRDSITNLRPGVYLLRYSNGETRKIVKRR